MVLSGQKSYHFALKNGGGGMRAPRAGLPNCRESRGTRRGGCPSTRRWNIRELECVTQRKLNQPRRSYSGDDFSESRRVLNVRHRRISEVGVVPDVEEIRREAQFLPLGQFEILDEGKVPVLLVRSAENVPAQIAEVRGAEVTVRQALRRVEQRRGGEGIDVQIAVVDAALNAPRSHCGGERAATGQASRQRARSEARSEKRRPRSGIRYRERSARLENGDPAHGPILQQSCLDAVRALEERQVVPVADDEPVRAIEVREAPRSIERGLIVEGGIERSVAGGCRVG